MNTRSSVALVRVALPALSRLAADSLLHYAWLNRQGQLLEQGECLLSELGAAVQRKPLEMCLHPEDSLLACIELPPLPSARLAEAATLAADGLLLGGSQAVHLVHGPRSSEGQVQLTWLERTALQALLQLLRQQGVNPRGLYAAPYFLAVTETGVSSAMLRDGHLLVRQDAQRAWVHALPEEGVAQLGDQPAVWIGEEPAGAATAARLPADQGWAGPAPTCNLLLGLQRSTQGNLRWGRALACCGLAVLVWTLGLNLYAMRLADEGEALKARMVSRVQQVFPELPIILNPLQQARQQRDARLAGEAGGGAANFDGLVQQAASHMPFVMGNVERVDFDGHALRLTPRTPTRKPPADATWQANLAQSGLQAELVNGGWTLQPAADVANGSVAEAPHE
ncbi:type II secretion system protein GspL [Ectopseudomonas chengduensis]